MCCSRIPVALSLALILIFALPVFCLALTSAAAAETNLPLILGGCHEHHHPVPHPQPQHRYCYAGHHASTAVVQSASTATSGNTALFDKRQAPPEHDKRFMVESVIAKSPPSHNQVLRI
jgi:hypothetical protein